MCRDFVVASLSINLAASLTIVLITMTGVTALMMVMIWSLGIYHELLLITVIIITIGLFDVSSV